MADQYNSELNEGDQLSGYRIDRIVQIPFIQSWFYELTHIKTRASHIHISRDDNENAFSVAFKTVPKDSTGVAHILEHTVLCGSRRYPVHDPFFSMTSRSLNTFMNAFTASDWTMYPYATQNRKDFYNLMDVYLDAAFYPNLDRFSFMQEGHRLEMSDGGEEPSRLEYKGVVYNEMKGAMSSPDQVMARSMLNALYPDTTYGYNSGGDPRVIPELTHEDLLAFHKRHYHPSNAFFFTYGNMPLKDHLAYIHKRILDDFEYTDPGTEVPSQPRWNEPRTALYKYPISPNEDLEKKSQVSLGWLMSDTRDAFEVLALTILERILLGNAGAPLYKALIDSGLGSALSDYSGFDPENRDTLFSCGLKNVDPSSADEIADIIFNVLTNLADNGIDKALVDSAIHRIEFQRKEVTNSPLPYGLKLLLFLASAWFHGGDPVQSLLFDEDIKKIDAERSHHPFFEERIRRWFLENTHRVRLELVPDPDMEKLENDRIAEHLDQLKSSMSPETLAKIVEDAERLKQKRDQSPDLSVLPTLELSDIPANVPYVEESKQYTKAPAVCYELPTSGIFYFRAAAGLGTMDPRLISDLPFFCYSFNKIGTQKRDYVDLARLIETHTGGVGISEQANIGYGAYKNACIPMLVLNGKCLERNQPHMFDILQEMMLMHDFSDTRRLEQLLLEYKSGLESMIVHRGHMLAVSLASRNFSVKRKLQELWNGVAQIQHIKEICKDHSKQKLSELSENMRMIGRQAFRRSNVEMAFIGEESALQSASDRAAAVYQDLSDVGDRGFKEPPLIVPQLPIREGWSTSTAVSFVVRSFMTKTGLEHEDAPALAVIAKLLKSLYIHKEIREKGGAYGGYAIYQPDDGMFCFASYRDPHILPTLDVYDNAADFLRSGKYSAEDVKEGVLSVCSDIDHPDSPGAAGGKAFIRKLTGLSDETRRNFKERLMSLTHDQIIRTADQYFNNGVAESNVAVISSESALEKANAEIAKAPFIINRI